MIAPIVLGVALLLGSRGEVPREEKFQGALLAQAGVAPASVNDSAQDLELAEALRTRPSMTPAGVILGIGGGLTLVGAVVVVVGAAVIRGWGGVLLALLGAVVGASGLVMLTVGLIMAIATGVRRAEHDARIQMLRERPQPAPPPPPPSAAPQVLHEGLGGLLLASF